MAYQVSDRIQRRLEGLIAKPQVQSGLAFLKEDQERSLQEQCELTLIEAPTFLEQNRAEEMARRFTALGLEEVQIDPFGNVVALLRGTGPGPTLLCEAHMDTVFPLGSVQEVRKADGNLYAPGICDNTRGLAVLLSTIRGLNHAGLTLNGNVLFVGTTREEGMGALGGMKDFLDHHPELDASISVDGGFIEGITFDATGYRTQEYHFYGTGGHAYMAFGEMANPLHAAARAVAKIADLQVPRQPKTTYCVSNFHAGTDAAIHAIPAQATVKINFRAQTTEQLEELDQAIEGCVKLGCLEESDRWGKDRIRYDRKTLCDVPAGKQDPHAPIVEAAYAIVEWLGKQPYLVQGGSVNGNRAVAKGLPCVSIGLNEFDFKCHSLEEFFPTKEAYLCPQELFLLLLMLAGSEADPSVL